MGRPAKALTTRVVRGFKSHPLRKGRAGPSGSARFLFVAHRVQDLRVMA